MKSFLLQVVGCFCLMSFAGLANAQEVAVGKYSGKYAGRSGLVLEIESVSDGVIKG